ncbi:MAG: PHP domain-containing protein [Elusimicrobia bacterium]|nr:PHP domain-containing protein [Elusimicrobiota bacterium]
MDNLFADLHVHTKYSDGTLSPDESVRYAQEFKIAAISITDHDTTDGVQIAIDEGLKREVEVIPGIELSVEIENNKEQEMHILGYFINWKDSFLQERLKTFREARKERAYQILDKFKNLGVVIDEKRLFGIAGLGVIGRLHFAKALVENKIVSNISEAFWKYLAVGKPAYVKKYCLSSDEAIKLILQVGGIPVLAHPHFKDIEINIIPPLVKSGLKGIEVWHTKLSSSETKKLKNIADKLGLVATGGSDCHGAMEGVASIIGTVKVPYTTVAKLKKLQNGNLKNN